MFPTRVPFKPIQRFCKSHMGFRFKLPSYCYIKYKNIPSRLKITEAPLCLGAKVWRLGFRVWSCLEFRVF